MTVTIIGFICLLVLVLVRIPLAYAMGIVGFLGFGALVDFNWSATLSMGFAPHHRHGTRLQFVCDPSVRVNGEFG